MSTSHSNNFYVIGGTLRRDAPSYVQRQADLDLYEHVSAGRFCYVLTSRQMGKSSLMVRTAGRLREAGAAVSIIDLTSYGLNLTPEQWYDGMLVTIGQQLDLEDELEEFWDAHQHLGPMHCWMRAICEVVLPRCPRQLVIFIDEIDVVRGLPFVTNEFFAGLRELYNRRTQEPELNRLTFCLLGVATPSDLIRDARLTPFNIGLRIELTDFSEAEAAPLAQGFGRDDNRASALLNRVLYWTGGHPYLTQRLCQAVAENPEVSDTGSLDRLCESLFLSSGARQRDDNLLFVRQRLLPAEDAERAALLDLYGRVYADKKVQNDETSVLVSVLRLSGITRAVGGYLRVRNRIYQTVFDRSWINDNMPDAERRRQRAAYRQGLLRATALAAMVLAVISGLALVAWGQKKEIEKQNVELQAALAEATRQRKIAEEQTRKALEQQALAQKKSEEADEQRHQADKNLDEASRQKEIALAKSAEADAKNAEAIKERERAEGALKLANDASARATDSEKKAGDFKNETEKNLAHIYATTAETKENAKDKEKYDLLGAEVLYATALSLKDDPDTRAKLYHVMSRAEARGRLIWTSPKGLAKWSVNFSPDGRLLTSGSMDKMVHVWNV
ncbi:MAG TPA: AAA-like domain-containing protein, partial [Pyrinomonadaceae bacterium]